MPGQRWKGVIEYEIEDVIEVVLGAQDVSVTVTSQVRVKVTETGVSGMAVYGSVSQGIALLLAVLALN